MTALLAQHQAEIERNLRAWEAKPLLKEIYAGFYRRILALIDPAIPGRIVEIGSGIGNLKTHLPAALATDLFPNPWLDLASDGYELPLSLEMMMSVFSNSPNRLSASTTCPTVQSKQTTASPRAPAWLVPRNRSGGILGT